MKEINEAESWLQSAKNLFDSEIRNPEKYTVVVAQSIHSILRANDAMTLKFLNKRAMKHSEAQKLFPNLIKLNKMPSKFSDLRKTIIEPAIQLKSKVDYKGLSVSKSEAEKFLDAAKESLR